MPSGSPQSGKEKIATSAVVKGLQATGIPAPAAKLAAKGVIKGVKFTWKHPVATFSGLTFVALLPIFAVCAVVALIMGLVGFIAVAPGTLNVVPSKTAIRQIPRGYLATYEDVANQDEVPWTVLAGLGAALTKQGTTSPYDSIIRAAADSYPTVTPPIGGKANEGTGPMLLDSAAVRQLGGSAKAQNVQASVSLVGEDLSTDAQQLASEEGIDDYATEVTEPLAESANFWAQAVAELPIEQTSQTCAPPAGYTSIPSEIESIWSCELTGKTIYLEAGPGVTVPQGQASAELVAEALSVAYAYSQFGATKCNSTTGQGGVFPLPASSERGNSGVSACDAVSNITEAAKLVIAAAETPINTRAQPEWAVLPHVFVPPVNPVIQTAPGPKIWGVTAPVSNTCLAAIEQNLSLLQEPGQFSPDFASSTTLTSAQAKTQARVNAARYREAWATNGLSTLRTSTTCQPPMSGTTGSVATISNIVWYQEVASVAEETLLSDEVSVGEASSFSNLAGLVAWLSTESKLTAPVVGKTSLVPRLSSPPIALSSAILTSTLVPSSTGSFGIAARVISIASTYDGTPGATIISASGLASLTSEETIAGIPADWIQWAEEATSAECPTLSPLVLLAIGKNESTWGESTLPGVSAGANSFGAEGPMQFLPSSFAEYAVSVDGDTPSPYNAQDALFAAAHYLCADGAAQNWKPAVFQYCGGASGRPKAAIQCNAYVVLVETEIDGWTQDELATAVIPAGQLGVFVETAMSEIGLPYIWGGETNGVGFDCSGLVDYSLTQAGIDPDGVDLGQNGSHGATAQDLYNATAQNVVIGNPTPGDLVFFDVAGGGTSHIDHVGIYIGNYEMVVAPETGENIQTQPYDWPDLAAVTSP
jgi:hypothetical protein